jgi:hypothetical protein
MNVTVVKSTTRHTKRRRERIMPRRERRASMAIVTSSLSINRQRREADIHPVEISDKVTDDQEGKKVRRYPRHRALFERVHGGWSPLTKWLCTASRNQSINSRGYCQAVINTQNTYAPPLTGRGGLFDLSLF